MNEKPTGKVSSRETAKTLTDWKRLRSLSDREIRNAIEKDPEPRRTDAKFWKQAKVVLPQPKQTITIRLDADLLKWLRGQKGYQTRINAVLRTYMDAQNRDRVSG
jgi:uncharacterized protein (DUF4415 family)